MLIEIEKDEKQIITIIYNNILCVYAEISYKCILIKHIEFNSCFHIIRLLLYILHYRFKPICRKVLLERQSISFQTYSTNKASDGISSSAQKKINKILSFHSLTLKAYHRFLRT